MSDINTQPVDNATTANTEVIPYQTVRYGYDEENQCAYIVRQYDPCEDSEHIDDGQEVRD
ncbi:MAG: hypothetical protein HQM16_13655, partial [Deltaproteobacteria bacterium]|nr:hypothetical protein [Deltaproteobacteria bacterium]